MTQQDLQGIASFIAPGSTVRDPGAFARFLEEKEEEYRALTSQPLTPDQENVRLLQTAQSLGVESFPGLGAAQNVEQANEVIRAAIATRQRLQQFPLALERREAATGSPGQSALTGLKIFGASVDPFGEILAQSGAQIGGERFGTPGAIVGGLVGGAVAPVPRLRPTAPRTTIPRPGAGTFPGVEGAVKTGRGVDAAARSAIRNLPDSGAVRSALDRVSPVGTARALGPEDTPAPPANVSDRVDFELEMARTGRLPRRPRIASGDTELIGSVQPDGSVVLPPESLELFGVRAPDIGLAPGQILQNRVRAAIPEPIAQAPLIRNVVGEQRDDVVDQLFKVRADMIENASSRGRVVSGRFFARARDIFSLDEQGRIPELEGLVQGVPGAPTVQDVAARLPLYRNILDGEQLAFMEELRVALEPYGALLRGLGDDFGQRTDVMEGGFYIPRGSAETVDAPQLPRGFSRRPGTRPGFERPASFDSQAEGIEAGFEYADLASAIGGYVQRAGRRAADQFASNYLATVREASGQKFGLTAKELALKRSPDLVNRMDALRAARQRFASLANNKSEEQLRALDQFLDDPFFSDLDGVRKLFSGARVGRIVDRTRSGRAHLTTVPVQSRAVLGVREVAAQGRQAQRELTRSTKVTRGRLKGATVDQLRDAAKDVETAIAELKPAYDRALQAATRGRQGIGRPDEFPQLNGKYFPERMAARANQLIQREAEQLPEAVRLASEAQGLFKGMQATLDNSGVGIQALLSAYNNPRAFAKAIRYNVKAFGSEGAYGDWANEFNRAAQTRGTLSVEQWADNGLRQIGRDPDVTSSIPERIPHIGGAFRGANRAFSVVSDVVRAEWADDLLLEELAKGRTLDDVIRSGDARRIATFVNAATGYQRGNFSVPNLILFSTRFLASRFVTLARAIRGVDIDAPFDVVPILGPKIQRTLPKTNPVARLEDKLARRAVLRMIAFGTLLTVALNEAQGRDTDFRPVVGGRPNPNFMRFRFGNRDWSVFGPWDSVARLISSVGTGNFKSATRTVTNAPFASLGWDLAENKDFFGNPIIRKEKDTFGNVIKDAQGRPVNVTGTQQVADFMTRVAETTIPFSLDESPTIIRDIAGSAADGHLKGIGVDTAIGLAEALGVKSSPLSNAEIEELLKSRGLDPELRAELEAELVERKVRRKEGAASFFLPSGGQSATSAFPSGRSFGQ